MRSDWDHQMYDYPYSIHNKMFWALGIFLIGWIAVCLMLIAELLL